MEEYDNLDALGVNYERLKEENRQLTNHTEQLENDIVKLCTEIKSMKLKQDDLTRNISELFKTAKCELLRKDKTIAELRKQLQIAKSKRDVEPVREIPVCLEDKQYSKQNDNKTTAELHKQLEEANSRKDFEPVHEFPLRFEDKEYSKQNENRTIADLRKKLQETKYRKDFERVRLEDKQCSKQNEKRSRSPRSYSNRPHLQHRRRSRSPVHKKKRSNSPRDHHWRRNSSRDRHWRSKSRPRSSPHVHSRSPPRSLPHVRSRSPPRVDPRSLPRVHSRSPPRVDPRLLPHVRSKSPPYNQKLVYSKDVNIKQEFKEKMTCRKLNSELINNGQSKLGSLNIPKPEVKNDGEIIKAVNSMLNADVKIDFTNIPKPEMKNDSEIIKAVHSILNADVKIDFTNTSNQKELKNKCADVKVSNSVLTESPNNICVTNKPVALRNRRKHCVMRLT